MEISVEVHKRYCRASSAYRDLDALRHCTGIWDPASDDHVDTCYESHKSIFGHPLDVQHTIDGSSVPSWRVDGAEDFGQHLLVVPILPNISVRPLFIDVFIDLSDIVAEPGIRTSLNLAACAHTKHEGISKLGISRVVKELLGRWTATFSNFARVYNHLPFGTRLCIDRLHPSNTQNTVRLSPSGYAHLLQNLDELASSMGLDLKSLPPTVSISELSIVRRCGEAVSIVTGMGLPDNVAILKACVTTPQQLYHELSILAQLQQTSFAPKLLGIATVDNNIIRGGVVGFLLQYYPSGSLSRLLPNERHTGCGGVPEKSFWGLQLSKTLKDLLYKYGHFYGELKTENIVVSKATSGFRELILIDYEQNGVPNAWSPPEITYAERIFSLLKGNTDIRVCEKYGRLLGVLLHDDQASPEYYRNLDHKSYRIWKSLSTEEADAAMVFMLGKVLYCIFENTSCVTSLLAQSFHTEPDIEFPDFRQTPLRWQELILHCTVGARERLRTNGNYIQRRGNTVVPGYCPGPFDPRCTRSTTISAARNMWLTELQEMETYVQAKERYTRGVATQTDMLCLHYLQRPRLGDVIRCIEQMK